MGIWTGEERNDRKRSGRRCGEENEMNWEEKRMSRKEEEWKRKKIK